MRFIFYRYFLLYLLVVFPFFATAQSVPADRFKFQSLGIDDGLSQGAVSCIVQDKWGFMWFGTKDGLNKYDGYTFKVYHHDIKDSTTLSGNNIIKLLADSRGLIWIWYANGEIDVFNPETEKAYHLAKQFEKLNIVPDVNFRFMQKKGGQVFFTDSKNYVMMDAVPVPKSRGFGYRIIVKNLDKWLPALGVNDLLYGFISSDKKLYLSFKDSVYVYPDPDISKDTLPARYLYTKFSQAIPPDHDNNIPSGYPVNICAEDTMHHRLLSVGINSFTLFDTRKGTKTDSMLVRKYVPGITYLKEVCFDKKGRVWITTWSQTLLFDPATKVLKQILPEGSAIKGDLLTDLWGIYSDRGGVVWLGTSGYGLLKYNMGVEHFHHIEGDGKTSLSIHGIWEDYDHNHIWFTANESILYRYDRATSEIVDKIAGTTPGRKSVYNWFNDSKIKEGTFFVDKNGYWLLTPPSTIAYLDRKMNVLKKMITGKTIDAFGGPAARDSKGNVWIATGIRENFVLHMYNEDIMAELKSYWFPKRKTIIPYPFTSSMVIDEKDKLWMGSVEGLYRFDPVKETWTWFGHDDKDSTSLPVNTIFSLCKDPDIKDILWIGTNGEGLVKFNMQTGKCITTYNTQSGLPNNVIYGILSDQKGNLWMSTNNGIARFNPGTRAVKDFTEKDGLQSNEFNRYAYCKLQSGEMVFGGVNGFNIFNPEEINENPYRPELLLTSFKIGSKQITRGDDTKLLSKDIFATNELHLRYSQNFLTFSFAATDYSATEKIFYRYKLESFDNDWHSATTQNSATYTNLDPGEYTFRVMGTNSDGIWSNKEVSVKLFIAPPWWGTWWFRILAVLVVIFSIYGLYRYRLQQALRMMSLRNRIASDLHDEVGSTLSSISLYSEAARKMLTGNEAAGKVLTRINTHTSEMMDAMNDIVWAINTRNDKLDNLVNRMRSFAVQVSESKNFNLHFTDNEDMPPMSLDMYQRKNLYLIFKEAINNIAKYADCKTVWVEFSNKGGILHIKIKDDGKGFIVSEGSLSSQNHGGGNGLFNIKRRADDLKAKLDIISEKGRGTEISLFIKLKKS